LTLDISSSTVVSNSAVDGQAGTGGSGFSGSGSGGMVVASQGGGIFKDIATVNLMNSTLANNQADMFPDTN
jgi:hypothetical protein